ncbi:MAG TPA: RNA polymerase sigma factor [Methylomirabilota bacterium]|nr:RNA polymerase sigma factor [Methylomirabilota bacterium]
MTDERLLRELLAQAPGSAELLVHRYGARIYRLALRITGSPEDAQEACQDVLWSVVRKIGTFKGESALGSWIYRITANAAYEKLRGRKGKDEVSWEALLPAFDGDGYLLDAGRDWTQATQDPVLQGEVRGRLREAIDSLPADYRTAFVLHDMEGLSNPEIAELLSISLPAVKSRVHRSRLFLRQRLAEYFGSG